MFALRSGGNDGLGTTHTSEREEHKVPEGFSLLTGSSGEASTPLPVSVKDYRRGDTLAQPICEVEKQVSVDPKTRRNIGLTVVTSLVFFSLGIRY